MKNLLLLCSLFLGATVVMSCEKEDDDPYGNNCEAAAGTVCTTVGTDAMSGPATWRRINGTPNRFRVDFQSGNKNIEIDMYSNDTIPYANGFAAGSTRAAGTSVITYFDGTDEWVATEGDASIDGRDNDLLTGRFNGKLTKVGGTKTMYIKASSFKQLPKAN